MFGIAGVFFGILVGWMLGSQQLRTASNHSPPSGTASAISSQPEQAQASARLDERRAAALVAAAQKDSTDAASRVQLGNLYFDAERFSDAVTWYENALAVDPRNVNVSTDLGIAYYYMNQADRALAQFERSLAIDPKHTKTLLNIGIVRAFGKQDLEGAAKAWQQARMARQALEGLRSAHPEAAPAAVGGRTPLGR
jgi:tetratricopeptide (TPR) repeat protein